MLGASRYIFLKRLPELVALDVETIMSWPPESSMVGLTAAKEESAYSWKSASSMIMRDAVMERPAFSVEGRAVMAEAMEGKVSSCLESMPVWTLSPGGSIS